VSGDEEAPAGGRRDAALLWAAQFVSATGDAVFLPCVAWLAGRLSPEETPVGLAVALATVPFLLFGPLAGAWVDRSDRRRVMIVSDLLRAGLLLGFAGWAFASGSLPLAGLLVTAFLLGAFSTPFAPARDALLPDLLPAAALPRWNAIVQTSAQAAQIVGLLLGALLLGDALGPEAERRRLLGLIAWDGASFLVSAALLLRMAVPARAAPRPGGPGFWQTAREGWRYASGDTRVRRLLVLTALDNLAIMGPAIVGAALLVQRVFGLGARHLAAFEGAMAAGMLIGSCVLALGARRWPLGRVLLWGMVLDGLTYLPFAGLTDFRWALAAILLHGACIPFLVVARTSLLHRIVPAEHRGQVFALVGVTVAGMTALSAAASGWVASLAGVRALFLGAGTLGAACGLLGFLWMGGRLRTVGAHGAPAGVTSGT
jgi:MFS family permease